MNKKRFLCLSLGVVALTAIVAGVSASSLCNGEFFKLEANDTWYHYSAVDATYQTRGIKEYWTNCNGTTQLTAPSGTIVERGQPSVRFIDSLAANDDRLVSKGNWVLSFENATDADHLVKGGRNGITTKTVTDELGATEGSKALKVMVSGTDTMSFVFSDEYLAKAFSDPSVVSIQFDAKADIAHTSFMYKLDSVTTLYEGANGFPDFGLTTYWKTFEYPRSAYETYLTKKSTSYMCWCGGMTSSTYILIDNVRPATTKLGYGSFGTGRMVDSTTYPNHVSIRNASNSELLTISPSTGNSLAPYGYDEVIKSEGAVSAYVTKVANQNVFIYAPGFINLVGDNDLLSIDFYTEVAINANPNVSNVTTGKGNPIGSGSYYVPANTWTTILIPKTEFNATTVLMVRGSVSGKMRFDNIHVVTNGLSNLEGFNDESLLHPLKSNFYYYGAQSYQKSNPNFDYVVKVQDNGAIGSIKVSPTIKNEGKSSLMIKKSTSDEVAVYASNFIFNEVKNNSKKLTFDLYRTSDKIATTDIHNGMRAALLSEAAPANTWKTFTINSAGMTDDGRFLLLLGSGAIGEWYIDNLQIVD